MAEETETNELCPTAIRIKTPPNKERHVRLEIKISEGWIDIDLCPQGIIDDLKMAVAEADGDFFVFEVWEHTDGPKTIFNVDETVDISGLFLRE